MKIVERLVQADGNGSHGNLQRKDLFSRTIKGGNCSFLIDIIEVVIKLKTPCFIDRTFCIENLVMRGARGKRLRWASVNGFSAMKITV